MDPRKILNPETEKEFVIISDSRFIEGCNYGKPRKGHPEGKVVYHIKEVLENIDIYSCIENRNDLRLVGLIHDTFKYKVDETKPKSGDNHHGMIARKFAENYIQTPRILETIQLHDEAYNSWKQGQRNNDWINAEKRARKLIKKLENNIDFYLMFYNCDNLTGDKSKECYDWFVETIKS